MCEQGWPPPCAAAHRSAPVQKVKASLPVRQNVISGLPSTVDALRAVFYQPEDSAFYALMISTFVRVGAC